VSLILRQPVSPPYARPCLFPDHRTTTEGAQGIAFLLLRLVTGPGGGLTSARNRPWVRACASDAWWQRLGNRHGRRMIDRVCHAIAASSSPHCCMRGIGDRLAPAEWSVSRHQRGRTPGVAAFHQADDATPGLASYSDSISSSSTSRLPHRAMEIICVGRALSTEFRGPACAQAWQHGAVSVDHAARSRGTRVQGRMRSRSMRGADCDDAAVKVRHHHVGRASSFVATPLAYPIRPLRATRRWRCKRIDDQAAPHHSRFAS